jgi:8-oxo-dGTP pyrophosphatase MutT (NUDIX family)
MWRLIQLILWPALYLYFLTIGRRRTRVFVRCANEVLLIQDKLPLVNDPDAWSLPGGGIGRKEPPGSAAKRELYEELGIDVHENDLFLLGAQRTTERGIRYQAWFYLLEIPAKPKLVLQRHEVRAAEWCDRKAFVTRSLNPTVKQALALLKQQ